MKTLILLIILLTSLPGFGQNDNVPVVPKYDYSYQYALIEASRQKMIGNINEAIKLYQNCIKSNPDCDVAYYELGTVYSALGENSKAEDMLANSYKLDPSNYWYAIAYSELLKQNHNDKLSLKVLKNIKRFNKSNSLTIDYKIAEILSEQKKFKEALEILEKIEKEYGISELISLKKIEIFKSLKKIDKAETVFNELLATAPDIIDYQILLAEFYKDEGLTEKALNSYEKAFQIDSSNIYAVSNLADMYSAMGDTAKSYYYLNQAFKNKNIPVASKIQTMVFLNKDRNLLKNNSAAIEEMIINLLKEYPDNYDVKTVAYDYYNGVENNINALAIIKDILSVKKDDYLIWQQALYNASMLENYNELIIIGEEALKYFPNKNEIYLFVGMSYFQLKDYEKSFLILSQAYSNLKEKDSYQVQFLLFLTEAAYNSGRKDLSYSYFEKLLVMDPDNDLTKNNYAYYLSLDSLNLDKARMLSYSTIQKAPENCTFLDTYAWVLFKLGEYENARYFSEKALIINNESDADIIFHYAEILFKLNQLDLSEKYYKLALDKGYDEKIILLKLENINEQK